MSNVLYRVREALSEAQYDAIIITSPENRFYVSGFTGSAGTLLVTPEDAYLFTDFRYTEQASQQAPSFTVVRTPGDPLATLASYLTQFSGKRIAFESEHATVLWHQSLEAFGPLPTLLPVERFVEKIRSVKTPEEIEKMAVSARLADEAYLHILGYLRPGITEIDVALELEFFMRKRGASGLAFDIIVASGVRSSMPHGRASAKIIESGDFVTMDLGAKVDGYCSDLTRTVVVGTANSQQREIYGIVHHAHMEALKNIGPGRKCRDVDAIARQIIADAGYGEYFGHGLGHGVGVVVHEMPRLSPRAGDEVLAPGNVVSNEPGIYIPGWGGVRIEDLIAVTGGGHRNLNSSTKELIEIK